MTESKSVTMKPEGDVSISTGPDGKPVFSSDKPISSHIENILSYGIENIVDIHSYTIEQKDGKTYHHVVFNSGGSIELSFEPGGKNFSASAHEMLATVTGNNRILIKERNGK